MDRDFYMSADQAKDYGMVDEILVQVETQTPTATVTDGAGW